MDRLRLRNPYLLCAVVFVTAIGAASAQPSAFLPEGDAPSWERTTPDDELLPEELAERFIVTQPVAAKVAQLMMITLEGVTGPSGNDAAFFKAFMPGGVIMPQTLKPGTAAGYVNALREAERDSGVPLFIGADLYQLTTPTRSTPTGFIQLPSLLSITAAGESDTTRRLGRFMAEHARGMGFNLHLGPPLTLAPTLESADTGIQTFGSDPRFAAEAGMVFHDAFQEAGIIMMPLGYPGGGANRVGRGAAVLTTPRPLLTDLDALPYHELARHGARIMHVGNTLVPTLDVENRPASLSPVIIRELLRGEAAFDGVIVAGPLDDESLRGRYEHTEAAVRALMAGADMLLWGGGLLPVTRAIERITKLVASGDIEEERIDASLRRVLALKSTLITPEKPIAERQAQKISRQKELREESLEIERRAITLVKNDHNVLPLLKQESTPVGITGVVGVEELHELLSKEMKPVMRQRITTARHLGEIQRFEIERLTRHISGLRTLICILTDGMRVETQMELLNALRPKTQHLIVVYLGNPRDAARLTNADAMVLAYCEPVMLEQTMSAMNDILIGKGPVSIMPVADEIRLRVGETRSFNAYEILRVPSGRLPIALSDQLPAGSSARYNPSDATKRIEWDFAGKRIRREAVAHTFDTPGTYPVTLTVTDTRNDVQTRTFTVTVTSDATN